MSFSDVDINFSAYKKKEKNTHIMVDVACIFLQLLLREIDVYGEMTKKIAKYYDSDDRFVFRCLSITMEYHQRLFLTVIELF